ncbi:unnamed protein product [Thlaspi arvense]|uniref:F-box associated beta-propeller type 3 domain-containing protein n=1 Tax=Thlaspi arvense TaxID=13288 RepID=A0AAU9RNX3_THLAR|nr:unnamed protein product [Thlaspi arvense]
MKNLALHMILHPSDPGRFTICNPSTRQVITLPEASSGRRESVYMCLGYDPVARLRGEQCQEHKVLTLGGGLSWRDVKGTSKIMSYNVVTN